MCIYIYINTRSYTTKSALTIRLGALPYFFFLSQNNFIQMQVSLLTFYLGEHMNFTQRQSTLRFNPNQNGQEQEEPQNFKMLLDKKVLSVKFF